MRNIERLIDKAGNIFSGMNLTPELADFWFSFKIKGGCMVITKLEGEAPIISSDSNLEKAKEFQDAMTNVLHGQHKALFCQWGEFRYLYWMLPVSENDLVIEGRVFAINTSKWDKPDILLSIFDVSGHVLYINTAVSERMGVSLDDLIGKHIDTFIHPDDISELSGQGDAPEKLHTPQVIKYRCLVPNGKYRSLLAIRIPITIKKKCILGFTLITSEV